MRITPLMFQTLPEEIRAKHESNLVASVHSYLNEGYSVALSRSMAFRDSELSRGASNTIIKNNKDLQLVSIQKINERVHKSKRWT